MTAYQTRLLEDIADATYARDYCQQKAWEYVGMREDSTTAKDYFESVKRWDAKIESLRKLAREEKLTGRQIQNAIQNKFNEMKEDE